MLETKYFLATSELVGSFFLDTVTVERATRDLGIAIFICSVALVI